MPLADLTPRTSICGSPAPADAAGGHDRPARSALHLDWNPILVITLVIEARPKGPILELRPKRELNAFNYLESLVNSARGS